MLTQLQKFFKLPPFENANQERIAILLSNSLGVIFAVAIVLPFLLLAFDEEARVFPNLLFAIAPTAVIFIAIFIIRTLVLRKQLQAASILLSSIFLFAVSLAVLTSGMGITSPSVGGFVVVIILAASISEGRRPVFIFTALSILITLGFYLAQTSGLLQLGDPLLPIFSWVIYLFVFILSGVLLGSALRRLNAALDRAQNSEQSLRELAGMLEMRVAERTKALETSAEISRRLSTILDQDQLVTEVVHEVQRAFGYYHVHIYLLDEKRQTLNLVGGTGEAGRALLAAGHKLPITRGLIGQAVRFGQTVLVPNVQEQSEWVANLLLPDTVAEIAVPITLGSEALGVLDVQHNIRRGLGENDKILLESITNQVAVALENARLYAEAQERGQREALVNVIGQRIQQAGSVEAVLQVVAQELGQALDVHSTKIQIGRLKSSS